MLTELTTEFTTVANDRVKVITRGSFAMWETNGVATGYPVKEDFTNREYHLRVRHLASVSKSKLNYETSTKIGS